MRILMHGLLVMGGAAAIYGVALIAGGEVTWQTVSVAVGGAVLIVAGIVGERRVIRR